MAAYVLLDVTVNDPDGYEKYKVLASPSIATYGGQYLVRGGAIEILEGDWPANRMVILEFESSDRAKQWINSPEYRDARELRHKYATSHAIVVEGI